MTKLVDRMFEQDGKIIHHRVHDVNPVLKRAELLRSSGVDGFSDNKLVATIPAHMITQWTNEAGLSHSDTDAIREVVKRKILSGEVSKLRVWEGTY